MKIAVAAFHSPLDALLMLPVALLALAALLFVLLGLPLMIFFKSRRQARRGESLSSRGHRRGTTIDHTL